MADQQDTNNIEQPAVEGEVVDETPQPDAENPQEPALLEENGGFADRLAEFFQEINFSGRSIFMGLGCLVLIGMLIFGGIYGYRHYIKPDYIKPATEISTTETGIQSVSQVGEVKTFDYAKIGETGISANILVGEEFQGSTPISFYITTFGRLQNAYETDVNELMDHSTERRFELERYVSLLKDLHAEGTDIVKKIKDEKALIQSQFDPQKLKQDESDKKFFANLNALNALATETALDDFIVASQRVTELKARFQSLGKIQYFYEQALPKIANRIKGIELNEEPLVAGMKVFDVKGANLKLIVPVASDSVPESERLGSPAFPFLPFSPQNYGGENDFISKPGGGFNNVNKK